MSRYDDDEIARRCSLCAIDWPDDKTYKICPSCEDEGGTDRCRDVTPLSDDEALSMKLHFEFERFYEEYDADADPSRLDPTPEDMEKYHLRTR